MSTTSSFQTINVGAAPDDGQGDNLRDAFIKVNNNFSNTAIVGIAVGNLIASGFANISGDLTIYGDFNVLGNINYNVSEITSQSNIHVTDTTDSISTTTGALIVAGGAGIAGNIYAGGIHTKNFYGNVSGTILTPYQPYITTLGNVSSLSANGAIRTTGIIFANAGLASTSTTTGALRVNGGIAATGNLVLGGGLWASGGVGANGQYLVSTGTGLAWSNLATQGSIVTGASRISVNVSDIGVIVDNIPIANFYTGNITVTGNLITTGTISTVGQLSANSGIPSISTTTGALTVAGGVGITGNVYATSLYATYITGNVLSFVTNVGILPNLTVTGNITSSNVNIISGLHFTTVGQRITGDFSNIAPTNRLSFQTSVANSNTIVQILPNGTGTTGTILAVNNSNPSNSSVFNHTCSATESTLRSDVIGTGTYLPITFYTSGLEQLRIDTHGDVLIGTTNSTNINNVTIGHTTLSTSSTTGALVVAGGVGVTGDINFGTSGGVKSANTVATSTTMGPVILNGSSGAIVLDSGGHKRISWSDGNADLAIRAGNYFNGNILYATGLTDSNSGAATISLLSNAVNGSITMSVANIGTPGNTVIYNQTLTLNSTGVAIAGPLTVNSANNSIAIINGGTTGIGNIGSPTDYFNTVYALATSAQWGDLAEYYLADDVYLPGTVVIFGGDKEITTTSAFANPAVAGAISTEPAYLMNSKLKGGLPVALRGRIPLYVVGTVKKGDLLVTSSIAGVAVSVADNISHGAAVFAKALEDKTNDAVGIIEAVII